MYIHIINEKLRKLKIRKQCKNKQKQENELEAI